MHNSILKAKVRLAEHKKRWIFDDIHILEEHRKYDNQAIALDLAHRHDMTIAEARLWLCRYKEHQIVEAGKEHWRQIDQWVNEIAEIKRKENRNDQGK